MPTRITHASKEVSVQCLVMSLVHNCLQLDAVSGLHGSDGLSIQHPRCRDESCTGAVGGEAQTANRSSPAVKEDRRGLCNVNLFLRKKMKEGMRTSRGNCQPLRPSGATVRQRPMHC